MFKIMENVLKSQYLSLHSLLCLFAGLVMDVIHFLVVQTLVPGAGQSHQAGDLHVVSGLLQTHNSHEANFL